MISLGQICLSCRWVSTRLPFGISSFPIPCLAGATWNAEGAYKPLKWVSTVAHVFSCFVLKGAETLTS